MYDFKKFAKAFADNFNEMLKERELFRVNITGHDVWDKYLSSFPEGTNNIFRVRTYHDGSYDRNVIRQLGNVVAIKDNKLVSIFRLQNLEYPYNIVAEAIADMVESAEIDSVFRINQKKLGHVKTTEMITNEEYPNGYVHVWNHLFADITGKYFTQDVGREVGNIGTRVHVFKRGLNELTVDALETVKGLIDEKLLYRGEEYKTRVTDFLKSKKEFDSLTKEQQNIFVWSRRPDDFKNTVIGNLVSELSENTDLEVAVAKFENMVSGTNYKRSKALITPRMIKDASKTIKELDLEDSLERRLANIGDITVNNVLWVNPEAKQKMKNSVLDMLLSETEAKPSKNTKTEKITMEDFYKLLPNVTSMEVLVKSSLKKNLMVLTAPVHADSNDLFKWKNKFGWSYVGNITDSIKERVKIAGGNIDAKLRVSLAWYNRDDLDIHANCPEGHVYFGFKEGILDVDMNVNRPVKDAVENLSWARPKDGKYKIIVDNYTKRETTDVGFTIEVEFDGVISTFHHPSDMSTRIDVIEFEIKNGEISPIKILDSNVTQNGKSEDIWGIKTETFVPVETLLNSPNHWDGNKIGNKHWFFILKDCATDEPMRGIYNEFLDSELEKHRKVFEVLGDKTKCEVIPDHLAGIGFSETKGETVTVRVAGKSINKTFEVTI